MLIIYFRKIKIWPILFHNYGSNSANSGLNLKSDLSRWHIKRNNDGCQHSGTGYACYYGLNGNQSINFFFKKYELKGYFLRICRC